MTSEAPTNGPSHDAQREMEQRALRNVRALVEKIEDEESRNRSSARKVNIALAVFVGVILLILGAILLRPAAPPPTVLVLPPPSSPGR